MDVFTAIGLGVVGGLLGGLATLIVWNLLLWIMKGKI